LFYQSPFGKKQTKQQQQQIKQKSNEKGEKNNNAILRFFEYKN